MSYPIKEVEELEPTFSEILFQLIKEKGISETDCYKNANLDRKLFSKIISNTYYQPRKNTVFALCIGLGLDLPEAKKLLDAAGFSLSRSIKMDVVMAFLFKKKTSDIFVANEILESFDCTALGQNKASENKIYCSGISGSQYCPPSNNSNKFDSCRVENIKPMFRYNFK